MARISKNDVYRALDVAAQDIKSAANGDGIVSRDDMKAKLGELSGTRRATADMLYRFIDHRDHREGARVTQRDVNRALEYAKKELVADYDLNNNGLSKDEIAKMSRTGKLAVKLAEELKARGDAEETTGVS